MRLCKREEGGEEERLEGMVVMAGQGWSRVERDKGETERQRDRETEGERDRYMTRD